jgi:hypothetical protein
VGAILRLASATSSFFVRAFTFWHSLVACSTPAFDIVVAIYFDVVVFVFVIIIVASKRGA